MGGGGAARCYYRYDILGCGKGQTGFVSPNVNLYLNSYASTLISLIYIKHSMCRGVLSTQVHDFGKHYQTFDARILYLNIVSISNLEVFLK